jgi:hypothetical protein
MTRIAKLPDWELITLPRVVIPVAVARMATGRLPGEVPVREPLRKLGAAE